MSHELVYVSANCNQTPSIADWGKNNLICYGSCCSVLIYDPNYSSGGKVIKCLVGHKQRVNSIKWIKGYEKIENEIISGSTDGIVIVWSLEGEKTILNGHEGNVNLVDALYIKNKCIATTVSIDGTVKIWERINNNKDFIILQTINYGYSLVVGLKLYKLPHLDKMLLACAPDNSNIDIFFWEKDSGQFELEITLKDHEDWVRGLDFTVDKEDILLASSSQDQYIRIWRLKITNNKIKSTLDSVLTGHEGWIYSVNWNKNMKLLSASLDKTLIIWQLENGLWVESARLGEVGGNTLGFYGAVYQPDGNQILAHSYHGAFHLWKQIDNKWEPCVTVGGHFSGVVDLAWEPKGEFLFSVSADQTTRIHAQWCRSGTWHEIARPQIHGYDMSAISIISRYKYASASEEKVIRTFEAPKNFIDNFKNICNVTDDDATETEAPKGASIPSLGLSNKAIYNENDLENDDGNSYFNDVILDKPPTEETLLQNTLWPEVQKLYGHGYEVYSLAASPNGVYLASACKATTLEHAAILLWDNKTWKLLEKLPSHNLTVVQMTFSPNNKNLLSVSRDRRWCVFSEKEAQHFELVATCDKKTSIHTRIIWCCDWTFDSNYFGTGSRDGKLVIWQKNSEYNGILDGYKAQSMLDLKESITALTFAPRLINDGSYLIALGFDNGQIVLYKWLKDKNWNQILNLNQNNAHHLTVKRLSFRPNYNLLQLASCSLDFSIKIHNIKEI